MRMFRLLQRDPLGNAFARQIKLDHFRRIPQAAPRTAAIACSATHVYGNEDGTKIARAQIESLEDFSRGKIEQHDVVRKIVRDQQFVLDSVGDHRKPGRIRNRRVRRRFQTNGQFLPRRKRLQRDRNEPFGRDFTFQEAVDGDAVSRVARPLRPWDPSDEPDRGI